MSTLKAQNNSCEVIGKALLQGRMYSFDFSLTGLHYPSISVHASPSIQESFLGALFNQSDSHLANLKWLVA